MSDKYKIVEHEKAHFITLTIVDWIDLFTRANHKQLIVDSLEFCQQNKGLVILSWCLMPSHLHLIARADGEFTLPEIIRDFKKYTAKKLIAQIEENPESRREWLLESFEKAGKALKRIKNYKVWQDGNHAKIIYTPQFFYEKLNYIHNNPVEELIVQHAEDYMYSSARNYAELDFLLDVEMESQQFSRIS